MILKHFYKSIFALLTFFVFTSCQDVIDVDLNTAEPRLVIDAAILWEKETDGANQTIKLSTTTDYFAEEIPPVLDATVFVTNSQGQQFDFIEEPGTGNYVCNNFVPELNETYELTVITDNETYTATEQLIPVPEITRVEQENNGGFTGDSIEVHFFFFDNGDEDNYYLSKFEVDFLLFPEYYAISDQFTQGNEMFEVFTDEDLAPGDELHMSLSGISEPFYNYMTLILESTSGNPFNIPPGNIRGNIVNETDEDNYALGYFRLSEVSARDYIVE